MTTPLPQHPPARTPRQTPPEPSARPTSRHRQPDEARAAALEKVCAGFTPAISPHSAARLANLLTCTAYAQAA
jgi:hypothetical protein